MSVFMMSAYQTSPGSGCKDRSSKRKPRESGHVAEGAVDLDRVHDSLFGRGVSLSVYLDAGSEFLFQ